jgi:hypothetical protein
MEEQISATFAEISDSLPGLRVYANIYNDEHELDQLLQTKIVKAYRSFTTFCIAATKFYTQGTFGKLGHDDYPNLLGAFVLN